MRRRCRATAGTWPFSPTAHGRMDVWVGRSGRGSSTTSPMASAAELVNPSVRTLGFSPDGVLVTFWARRLSPPSQSNIDIWAIPVLGGAPRPYLEGIAEFDWSGDGARLVYHTPAAGDPMFVREAPDGGCPSDLRGHPGAARALSPCGRPTRAFIYFVQGSLPGPDGHLAHRRGWRCAGADHLPRCAREPSGLRRPQSLLFISRATRTVGPWLHSHRRRTAAAPPRQLRRGAATRHWPQRQTAADWSRPVSNPRSALWRIGHRPARSTSPRVRRLALTTVQRLVAETGTRFPPVRRVKG